MEFSVVIRDNILVITPQEENLDAMNASSFKEGMVNLIQKTGRLKVILDLGQLQFVDSSGLGAFLSIQRNLRAKEGALKLAHLSKPIRSMFEVISMHQVFDIFESVEEAAKSF